MLNISAESGDAREQWQLKRYYTDEECEVFALGAILVEADKQIAFMKTTWFLRADSLKTAEITEGLALAWRARIAALGGEVTPARIEAVLTMHRLDVEAEERSLEQRRQAASARRAIPWTGRI